MTTEGLKNYVKLVYELERDVYEQERIIKGTEQKIGTLGHPMKPKELNMPSEPHMESVFNTKPTYLGSVGYGLLGFAVWIAVCMYIYNNIAYVADLYFYIGLIVCFGCPTLYVVKQSRKIGASNKQLLIKHKQEIQQVEQKKSTSQTSV